MNGQIDWRILYGEDYEVPQFPSPERRPKLSRLNERELGILVGAMRRDLQLDRERVRTFRLFGYRIEVFREEVR